MAKLTLFFNNRPIDVFHLEESVSTIGRDPSNAFIIDSLAIAPTHLKIMLIANEHFIESLSEQFPTLLNNRPIKREAIHQGDKISIGKHTMLYSYQPKFPDINDIENDDTSLADHSSKSPLSNIGNANLQAINGSNIGLVITLNKAVTEINIADATPAIIAKRHDGYYISRLMDDVAIAIEGNSITSETKLENDSVVNIGENKYLFFIE